MYKIRKIILFIIFLLIINLLISSCANSNITNNTTISTGKLSMTDTPDSDTDKDLVSKIPISILKIIGKHAKKDFKTLTSEDIHSIDTLFLLRDDFIENGDDPEKEYDVSFLSELHNLTSFRSEVRLRDYSVLNNCYHLKTLALSSINDEDISTLTGSDSLLHLTISNSSINNLDFLKYYDKVRELSIADMPNFPVVNVLNSNNFKEKVYAPYLTLYNMNLSGSDIESINQLKSAHYLYLNNNNISQISNFPDALYLETLDLSGNPVESINITVDKAPKLKRLILRDTDIQDLNQLKGLDNLTEINLSHTKVKSIAPLKRFNNLKLIEVDVENIDDINDFKNSGIEIRREI